MLESKPSDWLKKYTDFNTEIRRNAVDGFEKYFLKLMINSVYGKTMANLRKRISVKLVSNEKDFLKYVSRSTYITHKIFDKSFAAIYEIKPVLMLKKPIYVGFTVLELSKWLMYDFHYDFIKNNFDAELLFTDTDSLAYELKSVDVCKEFFQYKHLFDFSNYPKDSKFLDETNKKVIGKMKDEFDGVIVDEFVGLKSKMYCIKKIDGKECNTAKGIKLQENLMNLKMFSLIKRHKMRRIQSKKHKLDVLMIKDLF